jgi:signal transduction histidine kinase
MTAIDSPFPGRLPGMRASACVLIVDDVPQNLTAMEALLSRDGVLILTASSGAEALEILLQQDVALALLDVQMPGMDGFALAELMRGTSRTRNVPIIFLTASPNDPARSFRGYESGAVDFLHKPIEPRVISGKVDVFIELHRQREELKLRNAELERSLRLNETMVAVLTHDLRTPLSSIMLCADRILDETADTALSRTASFVKTSAVRMGRMIEQLLDFSRLRSDQISLDLQDADLGEVCEEVANEARLANPGLELVVVVAGDLRGRFDQVRMGQVLSNLLGNAVLYGEGARVVVEVDGRALATLRVSVENRGHIADALLPRLFEPFKGAFNPTQGLGLGLYIVEQFVRAHGGKVSAQNAGLGVRVEVDLPRRTDAVIQRA